MEMATPAPAVETAAAAAPTPIDPKIQQAVNFLLDPSVMGMPGPKLTPYLKQRLRLNDEQCKEAFKLAGAAPRPRQGKITTAVEFLEDEAVKDKPLEMKVTYMKAKLELTDPEIAAALSQVREKEAEGRSEGVTQAMAFLQTGASAYFQFQVHSGGALRLLARRSANALLLLGAHRPHGRCVVRYRFSQRVSRRRRTTSPRRSTSSRSRRYQERTSRRRSRPAAWKCRRYLM